MKERKNARENERALKEKRKQEQIHKRYKWGEQNNVKE